MSDLFYLSEEQFKWPDQEIFSVPAREPACGWFVDYQWIIHVLKRGLQWRDAPQEYRIPKTLYNRFVRWSKMGVFDKIFSALVEDGGTPDQLMIDATHLKAHRTRQALLKRGCSPCYRAYKGWLKLETSCCNRWKWSPCFIGADGRQYQWLWWSAKHGGKITTGSRVALLTGAMMYWLGGCFENMGITPCIPLKKNRTIQHFCDKTLYRQRHKNREHVCKTQDWRRIAMRAMTVVHIPSRQPSRSPLSLYGGFNES